MLHNFKAEQKRMHFFKVCLILILLLKNVMSIIEGKTAFLPQLKCFLLFRDKLVKFGSQLYPLLVKYVIARVDNFL